MPAIPSKRLGELKDMAQEVVIASSTLEGRIAKQTASDKVGACGATGKPKGWAVSLQAQTCLPRPEAAVHLGSEQIGRGGVSGRSGTDNPDLPSDAGPISFSMLGDAWGCPAFIATYRGGKS